MKFSEPCVAYWIKISGGNPINLHFKQVLRGFLGIIKFKKHCSKIMGNTKLVKGCWSPNFLNISNFISRVKSQYETRRNLSNLKPHMMGRNILNIKSSISINPKRDFKKNLLSKKILSYFIHISYFLVFIDFVIF